MLMISVRTCLAVASLALLSACGGGDSLSGNPPGGGPPGGDPSGGSGLGKDLVMNLSTDTLSFTTVDAKTASPASSTVTANITGTSSGGTLYILVQPMDATLVSIGSVKMTGSTSGQATVTPTAPGSLALGSHSTTIKVSACINDPTCATNQVSNTPRNINLTYVVSGVSSQTSALSFNIGNKVSSTDLTQSFTVMGYPLTQTWTAAVDQPWLTVTPTSGSASQPVNVAATLEQAPLDALDSGTYTANISVKPANGGLALTIPVTLNITRVQVSFAAPHVAISNTTDTVIIRGENFSQITPTGVTFNTTAATSFSIVGNTEIIATYPNLAAGSYTVHVVNSQGIDRTTATMVVVDPPGFAAGTIAYPYAGAPQYTGGLLYDAERSALIANASNPTLSTKQSLIMRYGYASGSWGTPTQTSIPYPSSIALSVDGKQLLQAFEDPAKTELAVAGLDPVSLNQTKILDAQYDADATSMAIASDGEAVIVSSSITATGLFPIFGYSQLKSTLSQLTMPTPPAKAVVGASADGSAVLIVSNANASGPQVLRYDPITQATSVALTSTVPPPTGQASTISLNRHGTLALLNSTQVLDSSLSAVGSLPGTTIGAVLAPTAMRAYTYDQNGTVRTWNVSTPPIVEVTPAITLTGTPVSTQAVLTVSPDGGTLFLGLDSGIVITPTPLGAP
jgi:hypothetical protein